MCSNNTNKHEFVCEEVYIKSLRPSDAYMREYNIQSLVKIMACRLFSAKQTSEPKLPYCELD